MPSITISLSTICIDASQVLLQSMNYKTLAVPHVTALNSAFCLAIGQRGGLRNAHVGDQWPPWIEAEIFSVDECSR